MISHRQGFVYGANGSHPPDQKSLSNTTPSTHPMLLVKKKTWPSQQTSPSPPPSHLPKKTGDVPFFVYPIHPRSVAVHLPAVILALWQGSKGTHQNLGTHCWSILQPLAATLPRLPMVVELFSLVFRAIDFVCQTVKPSQRLKARFCNSSDLTRASFLLRAHKCV